MSTRGDPGTLRLFEVLTPEPLAQNSPPNLSPKTHPQTSRPKFTPKPLAQNSPPNFSPKTHPQSSRPKLTPEPLAQNSPPNFSPENHPQTSRLKLTPQPLAQNSPTILSLKTHPQKATSVGLTDSFYPIRLTDLYLNPVNLSVSVASICTTSCRVPASANMNQGPAQGDLISL